MFVVRVVFVRLSTTQCAAIGCFWFLAVLLLGLVAISLTCVVVLCACRADWALAEASRFPSPASQAAAMQAGLCQIAEQVKPCCGSLSQIYRQLRRQLATGNRWDGMRGQGRQDLRRIDTPPFCWGLALVVDKADLLRRGVTPVEHRGHPALLGAAHRGWERG